MIEGEEVAVGQSWNGTSMVEKDDNVVMDD